MQVLLTGQDIMLFHLLSLLLVSTVLCEEHYHGRGTMKCYGDQTITLDKLLGTGTGSIDCVPSWGAASAPPQEHFQDECE